jgi:hypothetical protein
MRNAAALNPPAGGKFIIVAAAKPLASSWKQKEIITRF